MDYRARWYIPALGRFASADTIVPNPGAPQAFNRYSYAGNNPLVYIDPSGHYPGQPPMHDYDDYRLVPISFLRDHMSRQEAVDYLVRTVQYTAGLSPAPGEQVVYGGPSPFYQSPDGTIGLYMGLNALVDGPPLLGGNGEPVEDEYVYIYENVYLASTTADAVGYAAHEITHSGQEYEIEEYNGTNVWNRPVACGGTGICPGILTAGARYLPGMEVEAVNTVLSLQSSLGFTGAFMKGERNYGDSQQGIIDANPGFFYPPGTRYPPGNRDPIGKR